MKDQVDLSVWADKQYLAFLLMESLYAAGQISAEMYTRILQMKKDYLKSLKKSEGGL